MKKILYVTTIGKTINAFLIPHINYLIDKGYKVDVACYLNEEIDKSIQEKGCNIFEVNFSRNPLSLKNIKAFKELKEINKKNKYDIVHVHTPVASFVTRLALRKEKNLKMVYTCHGFHFYKGSSILNWMLFYPLEKLGSKFTDILVTINSEDFAIASKFNLRKNGKTMKINGVGIEKEKYVMQEFNRNEYRKTLNLKEDDFVILVLAELNKNKNHIQLIQAMNLLKHEYPKIKAIFAGSGPLEEELKKEIKEYGLEEKISLLGWRNDVKELVNSSDIVALFSKREGLGKCLLEAMICEKCVIATDTRGPRELIKHGENGFLLEIGNVDETREIIELIYLRENMKRELETNGHKTSEKYLLENVLSQLDDVYEGVDEEEIKLVGDAI